ncbi:MAG: hypothetical protein ACYCOU_14815 [Sulfobacillus sp.]
MTDTVYQVMTDLPDAELNILALDTFARWIRFALGQQSLGGNKLHPHSIRYATSIRMNKLNNQHYIILSDPTIAPYANIIDTGHIAFNIGEKMLHGQKSRVIPMPQANKLTTPLGSKNFNVETRGGSSRARIGGQAGSKLYAVPKQWGGSGKANFRTITQDNIKRLWNIPPMRAYNPAYHLSEWAKDHAGH